MAITRKLIEVTVRFLVDGSVDVTSTAIVSDDVEGTSGGVIKKWNAQQVNAAATALRDAVIAQAAGQGKPVTL